MFDFTFSLPLPAARLICPGEKQFIFNSRLCRIFKVTRLQSWTVFPIFSGRQGGKGFRPELFGSRSAFDNRRLKDFEPKTGY